MQLPCDGESKKESEQTDNEIAVVNADLDSVDDNNVAPKEEKSYLVRKSNPSLFIL
jgi:hypothetical protein